MKFRWLADWIKYSCWELNSGSVPDRNQFEMRDIVNDRCLHWLSGNSVTAATVTGVFETKTFL
jgi:hypothetical protein